MKKGIFRVKLKVSIHSFTHTYIKLQNFFISLSYICIVFALQTLNEGTFLTIVDNISTKNSRHFCPEDMIQNVHVMYLG